MHALATSIYSQSSASNNTSSTSPEQSIAFPAVENSETSAKAATSHTPIAYVKSHGSVTANDGADDAATSPDRTPKKCATVTMMLAKRITRNAWSVEDEHFFESNHMNVWQTLEYISSFTLRKRYNYEGYNDNNNGVLALASSWRRDSFVEKNVNPNGDEAANGSRKSTGGGPSSAGSGKYGVSSGNVNASSHQNRQFDNGGDIPIGPGSVSGSASVVAGANRIRGQKPSVKTKHGKNSKANRDVAGTKSKRARSAHRKRLESQKLLAKEFDTEYALSPSDYVDLIKCTFNSPRISAALERLMGTNVVRLTDRNYMKELRERIEEDYRQNLQKRIKARELKEVERERILIIEGKTKVIPDELADDPIFVVDKKADLEISKARAKLKTNREKNSERLKLQGAKWQRERIQHEENEAQRLDQLRNRIQDQDNLERQYTEEDATKGVDLLRIHDEEWRPCEQRLKDFLEQERAKMKERSERVPTPFTSDPKDMQQILRARKRFQETELRIRKHIDEQLLRQQQEDQGQREKLPNAYSEVDEQPPKQAILQSQETADGTEVQPAATDETSLVPKAIASDDASDISSGESFDEGSTISVAKQRYANMLKHELEGDVAEGLLISKDQYDHLRYEDEKIMQLRNARDIRELYQLAEEIIIGERIEADGDDDEGQDGGEGNTVGA
ncbi:putative golgin subfamily A member 6-like protein 3 isoform X1 [Musca domestica]|uniref:Golgin subfamily A member 6-like protein 3 isoform X1 n=1 Tax=Musca domestica TaxID=7370 RepID=A0ABM3VNH2_MUSDO|nr:putative golgin subfamily A member 6-like protein 3 isoform X1 [Musca domestica]